MSGQASPGFSTSESDWPQAGPPSGATAANPVMAQLNHNLELLAGLSSRQEALEEATQRLKADMLSWPQGVQREVDNILEKYPLDILPRWVAAIDDNNADDENLPPPLTPQVFAG